jgi:hypothetical protein
MEQLSKHISMEKNTHNNRKTVFYGGLWSGVTDLNLAVVKLTLVQGTKLPL